MQSDAKRQKRKVYDALHRERLNARQRLYTAKNRERINARARERYAEDPGAKLARSSKYGAAHRAERCAYSALHRTQETARHAKYVASHRKAIKASSRARHAANPQISQENNLKHRARKNGAPINDLTRADWEAIQVKFAHRCAYCGRKPSRLTQDHISPLSQGGSHTKSNVVPACQSCNSRKGVGRPLKPVQPLLI